MERIQLAIWKSAIQQIDGQAGRRLVRLAVLAVDDDILVLVIRLGGANMRRGAP
jgi:hypothetical protein